MGVGVKLGVHDGKWEGKEHELAGDDGNDGWISFEGCVVQRGACEHGSRQQWAGGDSRHAQGGAGVRQRAGACGDVGAGRDWGIIV